MKAMEIDLELSFGNLLLSDQLLETIERRVCELAAAVPGITACHLALWAARAASGLGRICNAALRVEGGGGTLGTFVLEGEGRELGTAEKAAAAVFDEAHIGLRPASSLEARGATEGGDVGSARWLEEWFRDRASELPGYDSPAVHHRTLRCGA